MSVRRHREEFDYRMKLVRVRTGLYIPRIKISSSLLVSKPRGDWWFRPASRALIGRVVEARKEDNPKLI